MQVICFEYIRQLGVIYSKTCLIQTLNKPETCLIQNLNKPETCLIRTLNKPETCLFQTQNKPETCINQTLNKPETCINQTLNKPETCINQTLDKVLHIFIILTCINQPPVFSEHKNCSHGGSDLTGFTVILSCSTITCNWLAN